MSTPKYYVRYSDLIEYDPKDDKIFVEVVLARLIQDFPGNKDVDFRHAKAHAREMTAEAATCE